MRFDEEWRLEHARLVKLVPGVRGYRQNVVVGREADGRAFSTPEGVTLMQHATTFIDEITTFLVEPRRLA